MLILTADIAPTFRVSREPSPRQSSTCNFDVSVIFVNKLNDYPMVTDDG